MKSSKSDYDIVIIGGGLAGLSAAIHLRMNNFAVKLIEKNAYPKHKVCGEYISNEVLPYLDYLGVDVFKMGAKKITKFELSSSKNKFVSSDLPLGGFGISRFALDAALYSKAKLIGVDVMQDVVSDVNFTNDAFRVETKSNEIITSEIVIGAYGKRSSLDRKLDRSFIKKNSPYLAIKTHVKGDFPEDVVALHNFVGGYCGVSKVEDDSINLCYITDFDAFKKFKDIEEFQEEVVFKNDFLKSIFETTESIFETPLTISQISFESKSPVENHILMCGDSAGMIHPLCGNGMSMAIRSAQMVSEMIIDYFDKKITTREQLEKSYITKWKKNFNSRLMVGHIVSRVFKNNRIADMSIAVLKCIPSLMPSIIKWTHGKPMIIK